MHSPYYRKFTLDKTLTRTLSPYGVASHSHPSRAHPFASHISQLTPSLHPVPSPLVHLAGVYDADGMKQRGRTGTCRRRRRLMRHSEIVF